MNLHNLPFTRSDTLLGTSRFVDTKDPCIVFDGTLWHIYGSGGAIETEQWSMLHATAPTINGPWTEVAPAVLMGLSGPHMAAPGVVYDTTDGNFHMAIQEDFMRVGGAVHYFVSADGYMFNHVGEILAPIADIGEAGLYDPHFSVINNEKYMTYAAMPSAVHTDRPFVPQPDIYLAKSTSGQWAGPWERLGKILDHDEINWHHNSRDDHDYEWGIEGPQLVQLSENRYLLNATSFMPYGPRGTRQRVFFACSESVTGPFISMGPVLSPLPDSWEAGENGHASVTIHDEKLYLFYQGRPYHSPIHHENNWRYGMAVLPLAAF